VVVGNFFQNIYNSIAFFWIYGDKVLLFFSGSSESSGMGLSFLYFPVKKPPPSATMGSIPTLDLQAAESIRIHVSGDQ
jgi:hypothetical protein